MGASFYPAVRAGLGAISAVGRLDFKSAKLQARVGIATGLVVVGDLIGEGSAQEQSVVGETPNLAARLQALAEPDTIVIAASTRRLVGDLSEYRDLGVAALTHGDVVIIPAVDRLSRDTTDLLVIARDLQRAGAGLRSMHLGSEEVLRVAVPDTGYPDTWIDAGSKDPTVSGRIIVHAT